MKKGGAIVFSTNRLIDNLAGIFTSSIRLLMGLVLSSGVHSLPYERLNPLLPVNFVSAPAEAVPAGRGVTPGVSLGAGVGLGAGLTVGAAVGLGAGLSVGTAVGGAAVGAAVAAAPHPAISVKMASATCCRAKCEIEIVAPVLHHCITMRRER